MGWIQTITFRERQVLLSKARGGQRGLVGRGWHGTGEQRVLQTDPATQGSRPTGQGACRGERGEPCTFPIRQLQRDAPPGARAPLLRIWVGFYGLSESGKHCFTELWQRLSLNQAHSGPPSSSGLQSPVLARILPSQLRTLNNSHFNTWSPSIPDRILHPLPHHSWVTLDHSGRPSVRILLV